MNRNQHHDVTRLENGNTLYIAWEGCRNKRLSGLEEVLALREEKIYGDVIREVNPDGEIVWEWFFKGEDTIVRSF